MLFHAQDGLQKKLKEAVASKSPSDDQIFELSAILEFIPQHFSREIFDLSELPAGQITFDLLWTLCPPHALLLSSDDLGQDRVLRVRSSSYAKQMDGSISFIVKTEFADSDGQHIGFVRSGYADIRIQEFRGTTSLTDLPASPLHLHPSYEALKADLIARGERILNLHGRHLQEYKGAALGPRDKDGNRIKFNVSVLFNVLVDLEVLEYRIPSADNLLVTRPGDAGSKDF